MINKRTLLFSLAFLSVLATAPVLAATIDNVDTNPQHVKPGGQINISVYSDGIAFILKDIPRNWTILDNSSNFVDYIREENTTTWTQGTGWIILQIPQNTKTNTTHTLNASIRGDYRLINITITQKEDIDNEADNQDQQNETKNKQNNTQDIDQKPQDTTDLDNKTDTQDQHQQQNNTQDMDRNQQNESQQGQDGQNGGSQEQTGFGVLATIFSIMVSLIFVYKIKG